VGWIFFFILMCGDLTSVVKGYLCHCRMVLRSLLCS